MDTVKVFVAGGTTLDICRGVVWDVVSNMRGNSRVGDADDAGGDVVLADIVKIRDVALKALLLLVEDKEAPPLLSTDVEDDNGKADTLVAVNDGLELVEVVLSPDIVALGAVTAGVERLAVGELGEFMVLLALLVLLDEEADILLEV